MISEWLVKRALKKAGIRVNGGCSWDMRVYDKRVFREILFRGSLGLGESYMKKWWDCGQLDLFFHKLLARKADRWFIRWSPAALWRRIADRFGNRAAAGHEFSTAKVHYDLGEDLYSRMLDPLMNYSFAVYSTSYRISLGHAQQRKLELICRKLKLQPGQHVLDIGCGFGAFAAFAAKHYGVRVTGITRSPEQARHARERCDGLPVEIIVEDYRECTGTFDRIVSIGMFEHVEYKNDTAYFDCIERCLKPDGLFLLHTIGKPNQGKKADKGGFSDPFIRKYVFPEGMIPDESRIDRA